MKKCWVPLDGPTFACHPSAALIDKNMNGVVHGDKNDAREVAKTYMVYVGIATLENRIVGVGPMLNEKPSTLRKHALNEG